MSGVLTVASVETIHATPDGAVSAAPSVQTLPWPGSQPQLSGDARWVAFQGTGVTIGDTLTGTSQTVPGSSGAHRPAISRDGQVVSYNLDDTVWVYDRSTGTTVDAGAGMHPAGASPPVLSADGRFVMFVSTAPLDASDTNDVADAFVHDLTTGTTTLASVAPDGTMFDRGGMGWDLTADGRFVLFSEPGICWVGPGCNKAEGQIYVRDVVAGTTVLVSHDAHGLPADGPSFIGSISDDGRFVAFSSGATNLVAGDTDALDMYIADLTTGSIDRLAPCENESSAPDYRWCFPEISPDGSSVAFWSEAEGLVPGDGDDGRDDVLVVDRRTGAVDVASADLGPAFDLALNYQPAWDATATEVAFSSGSTQYLWTRPSATATLVTGRAASPPAPDVALIDRLHELGWHVDLIDDDSLARPVTRALLASADVVVVSSSVDPSLTTYRTALATLPVPIVLFEPYVAKDLGLGSKPGGELTGRSRISIIATHPLAGGLAPGTYGVATRPTTIGWYAPVAGAAVVATVPGTHRATIFGIETGTALTSGTAPARRVGLFITYPTAPAMNANGRALLAAALDWVS